MFYLRDLLHGTKPGRIQSVGLMQLIPLIISDTSIEDDRFLSPMNNPDVKLGSSDYGKMTFYNESDRNCIVPLHTCVVEKISFQDHSMCTAGLVPKNSSYNFYNAACIQANQGGHIPPKSDYNLSILPYSLRESAIMAKDVNEFQKLWNEIKRFNSMYGVIDYNGQLDFFLDSFNKELDEFIAEFELIPHQIGAIVMIDGEIVGIERAPNRNFFSSIWEPLIRVCYGSLAIKMSKEIYDKPQNRKSIDLNDLESVEDLENRLSETEKDEDDDTKEIVRKILDDSLNSNVDYQYENLNLTTVGNDKFIGQIVNDNSRVFYSSLFTLDSWFRNRLYFNSEEFDL